MLKQSIYLIIGSLIAIFFINYFGIFIQNINHAFHFLVTKLGIIFSGGSTGNLIKLSLALFFIPMLIGFVPAGAYWVMKRKEMPYLVHVIWIAWIVLATSVAVKF